MSLVAGCPRCPALVTEVGGAWSCTEHGPITPLWRPAEVSYDAFAEHLRTADGFPTYLPWPMSPGWSVSDFGVVGEQGRALATVTCCSGTSALDGPVDVLVVAEEPGTGLGARCAGTPATDPELPEVRPSVRVRIESLTVPLWPVSTSAADPDFDRSVVAGEADGRWLWMVLRPASAILLLRDDWILRDVAGVGPLLVEMPFGGPAPTW
ncbi:DUF6758 family protein [Nocardioides sp.]|uniref:DUF6758 family protein n=1 Tax=Nocardioides sp. TaxID=35761 RepID=UPI002736D8F1|nr:DUF6758 family protein [Nocardioides sp.]MDP3892041.1 hypothetical protein [Nocardioides sp.]